MDSDFTGASRSIYLMDACDRYHSLVFVTLRLIWYPFKGCIFFKDPEVGKSLLCFSIIQLLCILDICIY